MLGGSLIGVIGIPCGVQLNCTTRKAEAVPSAPWCSYTRVFTLPTTARAGARGGGDQEAMNERPEGSTWHCEITLVRAALKCLLVASRLETLNSCYHRVAEHTDFTV